MLEIDGKNKITLQLSADVFWALFLDDELLDETNKEELDDVKETLASFPYGYHIDEFYKEIEGEDLIEATFYPYKQSTFKVDGYFNFTTTCQLQVNFLENDELIYRYQDSERGTVIGPGRSKVQINKYNNKYFVTEGGSIIPTAILKKP